MPDQQTPIAVELNGEPYVVEGDGLLDGLLAKLGLRPGRIAVEINYTVVPKARYGETLLKPGDKVEIINFVGGG